jgi:hypothetical protein
MQISVGLRGKLGWQDMPATEKDHGVKRGPKATWNTLAMATGNSRRSLSTFLFQKNV